jgi:RNA polymerase sigma-70 factor (ECF subfamily)
LLRSSQPLATSRNSPQGRVDERWFSGGRRCADRPCEHSEAIRKWIVYFLTMPKSIFEVLKEKIYFCALIHIGMKEEEQKIIRLLKEGDNAAYNYLYDRYYTLLCAIAYEYLGDSFASEATVNELVFHLWEKRKTLEIATSLQNYLIRAVRNRCINLLRLEHEQREISFSSLNTAEQETVFSSESADSPLAVLLEDELDEKIMQAIGNLPADCRRIFKMSRFENKHYEQIAEETGISVNTVKYHIKNALARLKDDLNDYLRDAPHSFC